MADPKTIKTKASVAAFLNSIEDPEKRREAKTIAKIMKEVTREKPAMWGEGVVGYGTCVYKYADGKGREWPITGFAPRKGNLTVYIMSGFRKFAPLLKKLGKYKTGRSCLYMRHLADVDEQVLRKLISGSVKEMAKRHA